MGSTDHNIARFGLISSFLIWIVGKLQLGLEVNGYGTAFLAGLITAIFSGIITWLLSTAGFQDGNGFFGGVVHLVISAIILIIGSRILQGLRVSGFKGAIVASLAIGAFYWLGGLLLGLIIS